MPIIGAGFFSAAMGGTKAVIASLLAHIVYGRFGFPENAHWIGTLVLIVYGLNSSRIFAGGDWGPNSNRYFVTSVM